MLVGGYGESLELRKKSRERNRNKGKRGGRETDRKIHRDKMQSRTETERCRSAMTDGAEMPAERNK